jgi:hypothetical protein
MPNGQNVLVQTLPLRDVKDASERAARDQFERTISLATLEHAAAGDPILAHRAVGTLERTLVWLLPMAELARPKIRNAEELLGLGIGLLAQLEDRHQRNRTTPLLSEYTVTARGRLVGAQVFASGPWIGEAVTPIRLAPEELAANCALPSGDLWRLGQMLSELARCFALPSQVGRLVHPDPKMRPTVAEAIERFDGAFARITRSASQVARVRVPS